MVLALSGSATSTGIYWPRLSSSCSACYCGLRATFWSGITDRSTAVKWTRIARVGIPEQKGSALPRVLIKRIGAKGPMAINDTPVQLADIPRTLVNETGYDGSEFPGRSMFELEASQVRKREVYFSTFKSNPPYSAPYRSTMTVFQVNGFSWLDSSWSKTGKVYPPADASPRRD